MLLLLAALLQSPAPIPDEPLTLPAILYPAPAKAAHLQGTVHLEIHVDPLGHVTEVRALDGPETLRQAAIDAYSRATYRPLLKDARATPAIIATAVNFTLTEAPPDTDAQVLARFQPLHLRCRQLSATKSPDALQTCREALVMSQRFTPQAEPEARASASNDLVLLLIADGRKSTHLPEAAQLADQALALTPSGPASAAAHITRAEVRSLADDLPGAAADCAAAEETLTTLLQDQAKTDATHSQTETERAANYRLQLRNTLLLHAVILDRAHKSKEAKLLRARAADL